MNWRLWTWKEIAVFAIVIVVLGAFFIFDRPLCWNNLGFGFDWKCQRSLIGEEVCLKKPTAK